MTSLNETVADIFRDNGIIVFDEDETIEMDSLMYISIIVRVEDELSLEIPDEYLANDKLTSLSDFIALISSLLEEKLLWKT